MAVFSVSYVSFCTDSGHTLVEEAIFSGKMLNLCWMDEDNLFASGPDGLVVSV